VTSDEVCAVIGPLFTTVKATGRPPVDRRIVVEATAWRFRTGAPWRDGPPRFGHRNTIHNNLNRWTQAGARGIAATIPERDDQVAHQQEAGPPIDFGQAQHGICLTATLHPLTSSFRSPSWPRGSSPGLRHASIRHRPGFEQVDPRSIRVRPLGASLPRRRDRRRRPRSGWVMSPAAPPG
jgi:hypothetical protein